MRRILKASLCFCGFLAVLANCTACAAGDTHLWTVQAVKVGTETVCDAYAQGAHDRPPYEFRFRRSKSDLLFILSYDGQLLTDRGGDASIIVAGQEHTLPAVTTRFGARNALVVSISPGSVDFSDFDKNEPIAVQFGGSTFELVFLKRDHLSEAFSSCLRFAHIE
jgi:hypothetical protein